VSVGIPSARFRERLERTRERLSADRATALLVGVGPELEWLVGYPAHGLERLNLLIVRPDADPVFLGPRLELAAAEQAPGLAEGAVRLVPWAEGDDPYALVPPLVASAGRDQLLVSDGLRAAFLLGLQGVLPDARWDLASRVLAPLRRTKDADEVALLREAAAAADRVIEAIVAGPLVGRTEADVAAEVRARLVDEGHDTAEFAIVASGPATASPHHEPGTRVIGAGEPLLLDIGGRRAGYCSDTTRTFWLADADGAAPDPVFVEIHALVEEAQAAGRAAARAGATFASIDAAARDIIAAGGYGDAFFHRLGHGIGLEVHEEPWVIWDNDDAARAGDSFSVEPGIYLDGRHGVRIEDVVVCGTDGAESLNRVSRSLRSVPGQTRTPSQADRVRSP
jgi:Xaa-Pro aminopeptidase